LSVTHSGKKSVQFHENVQLDVTMLAVRCSIGPPSIPAHSALAPVSNVAVRVEKIETAVDKRRESALLQLQIAEHLETYEINRIDMVNKEVGKAK